MKRLALSIGVALLLATLSSPVDAAAVFRRSAGESYRDAETGLVFPPRVGEYMKTRVCLNQDPVFGTKIRYENEAGDCADVYLYALDSLGSPVGDAAFERHFQETRDSILNLPKQTRLVKDVAAKSMPDAEAMPHAALFRIRGRDEEFDSLLFMALFHGRVVKVRLSASDDGDLPESAFEFLNEIAAKVR